MPKKMKEILKVICEDYKIKEKIDEVTGELKSVFLEGVAITFDKPTRNGVSYTYQSGVEKHKGLISKPFLDSHHDDSIRDYPPYGHVVDAWVEAAEGVRRLRYKVDIDPAEEIFIRKAKRGDIPGVSIQVLVDEADTLPTQSGGEFIQAHITEFLELSAVLIPGDGDTTMRFVESFRKGRKEANEKPQKLGGYSMGQDTDEKKEDLTTSNGNGLIGDDMAKKIKKQAEKELAKLNPKTGMDDEREDDLDAKNLDQETDFKYGGKTIKYTKVNKNGFKCVKCRNELLEQGLTDGSIQLKCCACNHIHKANESLIEKTKLNLYKNKLLKEAKRKLGGKLR